MKLLVLCIALCGLVALTLGSECGHLQKLKVKQQWDQAFGHGHHRLEFGTAVFKALFAQKPEIKDLFKRVHGDDIYSSEFQAHIMRFMGGLDICISILEEEAFLTSELAHLAEQHVDRHIPANYFDLLGNALMEVIPAQLGRCFDEEAWEACYHVIADGVRGSHE